MVAEFKEVGSPPGLGNTSIALAAGDDETVLRPGSKSNLESGDRMIIADYRFREYVDTVFLLGEELDVLEIGPQHLDDGKDRVAS